MSEGSHPGEEPQAAAPAEVVGDALRAAVDRTLAATSGGASGTRRRAQGLVDDVVRRGQVARDEVARRGEEATSRLAEAIGELRSADDESLRAIGERLDGFERRLRVLEDQALPQPHSRVEAEVRTSELDEQAR